MVDDISTPERLDRALDAAGIVVWQWDFKTGQVLHSANAPNVLGLPPGPNEITWSGIHPDDVENFRRIVDAAIAGRRYYVAKVRFIRPDSGALRWLEIRGKVICESDVPVGVSGITLDVTDREEAVQALHQTEERYRAFVTAGSDAVYSMSPDWTVMRFLQGRDFIADTQDPSRTWLDKYIHPDDQAHVMEVIQNAIRSKGIFQLEHRVRRVDGTLGWTYSRAIPLMDSQGNITEWFGAASDVTERKAAEEALRRSEHELRVHQTELELQNEELRSARVQLEASRERYFDLYDLAPVGYLTLSEAGLIREANLTATSLLGVSRSSMPKRPLSRFIFKDDQDAYYVLIKNLSTTRRPQTCELRMTRLDSAPFWARLEAAASFDEGGTPGWRVVISDITERKQAEESLRQSEENLRRLLDQVREMNVGLERRVEERTRALQEANRELEAFGYSVSHDLRAPLRTLQGFSQALLEDYLAELPPKARKYLERVGVAAARMDELIQDLLAYSRLSRAELRLEPLELSGVVSEAWQQLQAAIEETRATMEVGPLPVVCGHRGTLVQIFANLFSNSLKFVSPRERPSIRVSAEPRGSLVRVWVTDNGIGIEPEHQERIFEVFQRLHGLETHPGTGIGLAIVRRGAERLGGAAGVESEPGRGSRFWVDLKPAEGK